jgi:2-oxoglutarate ferredoxin oxidoreductase subunit alpha
LNPLPPGLDNIFAGFHHVLVVELNDEGLYGYGQLASLLRSRFGGSKIQGLNKTEGLTFKVGEILERMRAKLAALAATPA